MAISFDVAVNGSFASTTLTWSHTCSGTNRYLVVLIRAGSADTLTGVTYNGVAMTPLKKILVNTSGSVQDNFYVYGLANPASGANNIVASASTAVTILGLSASYKGV